MNEFIYIIILKIHCIILCRAHILNFYYDHDFYYVQDYSDFYYDHDFYYVHDFYYDHVY